LAPLRGWGPRTERLRAHALCGQWKTLTFNAALGHDRIDAPWVIDGPLNGEIFFIYVEGLGADPKTREGYRTAKPGQP
jgi:hypothetical protein